MNKPATINHKTLAIHGGTNALFRLGVIFGMIVTNAIVARLLTPTDAGLYIQYWSLAGFLALAGNLGLRTSSVRWIATALHRGSPAEARAALVSTLWMSHCAFLTVGIGFYLISEIGKRFLPMSLHVDHLSLVLIASWIILWGMQYTLSESFRGFSGHLSAGLTGGLFSNAAFVLSVLLQWMMGYEFHIKLMIATTVVALAINYIIIMTIAARILFGLPRGGHWDIRSSWGQTLLVSISQLALGAMQLLDVWVVGIVAGPAESALYGFASRIAVLVSLPLQIVYSTALPSLTTASCQHDPIALQRMVRNAGTAALVPGLVFALVLGCFGSFLLPLLYGEQYAQASNYLRWLVLFQLIVVAGGLAGGLLLASGNELVSVKLNVVTAIVCIVAQLLSGFYFGPTAVPITSCLVVMGFVISQSYVCRKLFQIECLPFLPQWKSS